MVAITMDLLLRRISMMKNYGSKLVQKKWRQNWWLDWMEIDMAIGEMIRTGHCSYFQSARMENTVTLQNECPKCPLFVKHFNPPISLYWKPQRIIFTRVAFQTSVTLECCNKSIQSHNVADSLLTPPPALAADAAIVRKFITARNKDECQKIEFRAKLPATGIAISQTALKLLGAGARRKLRSAQSTA